MGGRRTTGRWASLVCLGLLAGAASAAAPSTSPNEIRAEFDVMIPMRDGVKLAADVWLPDGPGRYPVRTARYGVRFT